MESPILASNSLEISAQAAGDTAICPSCRSVINVKDNWTKFSSSPPFHQNKCFTGGVEEVFMVNCTSCDKCIGVVDIVKGGNGNFLSVEEILTDGRERARDGWRKIEEEDRKDRLILFTLSQIIYKEYERPEESQLEVEFTFPPPTDLIKLLWINRRAVGFYCVKPPGTFDPETMECYTMATLDTIFIRTEYRRQGYASSALEDILSEFPEQNIGFSHPVSIPMKKVLAKNLERRPQDRPRFWEITGCGSANSGNCRNLWLILHKTSRKAPSSPSTPD